MDVEKLAEVIGSDFYTGVPDSQLKPLCNYLIERYGIDPKHHLIAANEGNCAALAAGYHLATGKVPVVYMQNSGEGNIINPVASLLHTEVYGVPCIFVVGWRGEPGIHDEPQHIYQGKVTLDLLENMDIPYFIISKETTSEEIEVKMQEFQHLLRQGRQVAFVVRKGALSFKQPVCYQNQNQMVREEIIRHIVQITGEDIIISTTGKASRELFEIREAEHSEHKCDFLTVGSMGHSSSIALGIAVQKPKSKIWCIDGDGAVLMHMGAMALVGNVKPQNLVHIVINNGAHETVGGMPTVADEMDLPMIAKGCGYTKVICVESFDDLDQALQDAKKQDVLSFIEVKCSIGAREDLGRPTTTARENKENFMAYLSTLR